jgi:hypothetical protein
MRSKTGISFQYISAQIFVFLFAFLLLSGSPAHGATKGQSQSPVRKPSLTVEMHKILPVLEDKINQELQLIAALCEKIADEGQTVSTDIAFLLVTTLIILS